MRAIIRIIDPSVGRAVEFPQVVVTKAALETQLQALRVAGGNVYGQVCYGYIVYL